jgi:hypothetical protein
VIILDTNVVSEPTRPSGSKAVLNWLDRQMAETLYLTAISLSELLTGVAFLAQGKRRGVLEAELNHLVHRLFARRILAFDEAAARAHAAILGRLRSEGVALGVADGQIAAIAAVHDFTVATRDTAPFLAAGLTVIDPWREGA